MQLFSLLRMCVSFARGKFFTCTSPIPIQHVRVIKITAQQIQGGQIQSLRFAKKKQKIYRIANCKLNLQINFQFTRAPCEHGSMHHIATVAHGRTYTNRRPIHSFPNTWPLLAFYFSRFIFLFFTFLVPLHSHSHSVSVSPFNAPAPLTAETSAFSFLFREKKKIYFLYFHRRRCNSLFTSLCFKSFYLTRGIFNYDDRRLQHKIRTIYVVCVVVVGCAVES